MSLVITATSKTSRSLTQRDSTSAVLPDPTGPPTPIRKARGPYRQRGARMEMRVRGRVGLPAGGGGRRAIGDGGVPGGGRFVHAGGVAQEPRFPGQRRRHSEGLASHLAAGFTELLHGLHR